MLDELLDEIEEKFISGTSLRKLEKEYHINRKKLSLLLKERGLNFRRGCTEEDINEICELYKSGKKINEIEAITDIGRNTIAKYLRDAGLRSMAICSSKKRAIDMSAPLSKKICSLYAQGMSLTNISLSEKISRDKAYQIVTRAGISERDRVFRKYSFNENIFSEIDTEEKAYWLGFLYADGNVQLGDRNGIEISLKYSDKKHLEKFSSFINATPSIPVKSKIVKLNGKEIQIWRIFVFSKKMAEDLNKWGCTPRKSLTLKFPDFIDEKLMHHFMRGYFDGDGCLCATHTDKTPLLHFGIVGAKDFVIPYEDYLIEHGILYRHTKIQKAGKAIQTQHGGNLQARKLYDYFYSDANIFLDRKYDLFTAVLRGNSKDD